MYPGYMSEKNNNQYGAFGGPTMSTSSYYLYPLKNCQKIIDINSDEAEKGKPAIVQFGDNANQIAVARTLMGFIYMHLTDALGPLPYTEAFQAGEENFTPVFDSQETIYAKLDADLREAYNQFNESGSLSKTRASFGRIHICQFYSKHHTGRSIQFLPCTNVTIEQDARVLLKLTLMAVLKKMPII